MVRDHVRQRAVRILFSDIVNKAVWEPTPDCAQKYNTYVECRIRLTSPGIRGGTQPLALGHESISQPKPLSSLSTQPFELTLVLGLFVDLFMDCFPLGLGLRCNVRQVFPPGARYQGGGKVASGRRRG